MNTSQGVVRVSTGSDWKVHTSNTKHLGSWQSGNYGGDLLDDRLYVDNWNGFSFSVCFVVVLLGFAFFSSALFFAFHVWFLLSSLGFDFDDSSWPAASVYDVNVQLSADIMEPTVIHSSVEAKTVTALPLGLYLVEMSEIFSGWFEARNLVGNPGQNITFHVSTTEGVVEEFNMQDRYIFNSSKRGTFRMRFSFHEIQYITIDGLAQAPDVSDIIGYRLTSDFKRTGQFVSSNELITKMYNITVNNYQGKHPHYFLFLSRLSLDVCLSSSYVHVRDHPCHLFPELYPTVLLRGGKPGKGSLFDELHSRLRHPPCQRLHVSTSYCDLAAAPHF